MRARPTAAPYTRATFPSSTIERDLRRLSADAHVMLGASLAVGALVIAIVGGERQLPSVIAAAALLVGVQITISLMTSRARRARTGAALAVVRFALAIAFVTGVNGFIGDPVFRPAAVLYIPIVALAASLGTPQAVAVGLTELIVHLLPNIVSSPEHAIAASQRAIGLIVTIVVLSIGIRRTISALTLALSRLRRARASDRRRARQVSAVEEAGRLLAATGPTQDTVERVVTLLQQDLGYTFVSVYLGNASTMRLAASRGYEEVIDTFDGSGGIMGRVMRTKVVAFVPDVDADPDYMSADDKVRAAISAPLLVGQELIGIVNVEGATVDGLERSDLETVKLVADRLASALALARERSRLESRADLFQRLASFASVVNGTLDAESLYPQIVGAISSVIQADIVVLTVLNRSTGRYLVRALSGTDDRFIGEEMPPGQGLAGRAIRDRALVVDGNFDHPTPPGGPENDPAVVPLAGIAVPLIRDDVVVGALTLARRDLERPYGAGELEVLPILAGLTALAVTNTFLHGEVAESAIRDSLTGLFNRRHLDAFLTQMDAARARTVPDDRRRVAAILFDLDTFGALNKRYGHQVGDAVLRQFAEVLRGRLRTADIVARYGGEEFVVILEAATLEQASQVANDIRTRFAETLITGPDGLAVKATVSAGCSAMGPDLGTFSDLLARADMGLAIAKNAGRNRVVTA